MTTPCWPRGVIAFSSGAVAAILVLTKGAALTFYIVVVVARPPTNMHHDATNPYDSDGARYRLG